MKSAKANLKRETISKVVIALVVLILPFGILFATNNSAKPELKETLISDNYYTYTPARFQSSLKDSPATIVNFYANWCSSCSEMEPAIRDVLSELGPKNSVEGFKVNFGDELETNESRDLAKKYGVNMQSTLIVLNKQGKVFKTFFANVTYRDLRNAVLAASLTA